jgi:hypothetical protein
MSTICANYRAFGNQPIDATFDAGGEVRSTGLSFEDYNRMGTEDSKLHQYRRMDTPAWAMRPAECKKVVVRWVEFRAGIIKPPTTASLPDRMLAALQKIDRVTRPALKVRLSELVRVVVELRQRGASAKTIEDAERKIRETDSQLLILKRPASICAAIIYRHYMVGYDSVTIGESLNLAAGTVRKILWKVRVIAGDLGVGPKVVVNHKPRYTRKKKQKSRTGKMRLK